MNLSIQKKWYGYREKFVERLALNGADLIFAKTSSMLILAYT